MSREQIVRDTAYAIWEAEGKPEGRDAQHWILAEERVAASAGQPTTPVAGAVSSTATDTPKVTKPVKNAATKAAPAKPAAKAATSKSASKSGR